MGVQQLLSAVFYLFECKSKFNQAKIGIPFFWVGKVGYRYI